MVEKILLASAPETDRAAKIEKLLDWSGAEGDQRVQEKTELEKLSPGKLNGWYDVFVASRQGVDQRLINQGKPGLSQLTR